MNLLDDEPIDTLPDTRFDARPDARFGARLESPMTARPHHEPERGQALPHHATHAIASLAGVGKTFGTGSEATVAIAGITLSVRPGEFVAIVGASGCGKSTVLNLLAGLDAPSVGTVEVTAQRRSLMFQEAALFPWLTAAGNIELALRLRGVKKRERQQRARSLLAQVHLAGWAEKRPHELSGGMRQRVAIARSLASDPDFLLLDEPFGALDAVTKGLLQDELEAVRADRGFAAVLVTHDVHEAVRLGDRVVVMGGHPGRIAEVYTRSADRRDAVVAEITDRLREEVRRRETDRSHHLPAAR
jgi:NitT/TauT family transport system ATP-binding protein